MSKFEQKTYNDGEILFNSGDKAETFFIIKQGKIDFSAIQNQKKFLFH